MNTRTCEGSWVKWQQAANSYAVSLRSLWCYHLPTISLCACLLHFTGTYRQITQNFLSWELWQSWTLTHQFAENTGNVHRAIWEELSLDWEPLIQLHSKKHRITENPCLAAFLASSDQQLPARGYGSTYIRVHAKNHVAMKIGYEVTVLREMKIGYEVTVLREMHLCA